MKFHFFDNNGNLKTTPSGASTVSSLDDLVDVDTSGVVAGNVINRNVGNTSWVDNPISSVLESYADLDDLRDVDLTPQQWDGLYRNGSGGWDRLADAFAGHYWRVYRTGSVGLSTGTTTTITWQAKASDDVSPTNIISFNSTTCTVQKGGVYLIMAQLSFVNNSTGIRYMDIQTSGTTIAVSTQPAHATTNNRIQCFGWASLGASQTVNVRGYQNSGGLLNVNAGVSETWFSGVLVREYDLV